MRKFYNYLMRLSEQMQYHKLVFGKLVSREPISRIDTCLAGISKRTLSKWNYHLFVGNDDIIYPNESGIYYENFEYFMELIRCRNDS